MSGEMQGYAGNDRGRYEPPAGPGPELYLKIAEEVDPDEPEVLADGPSFRATVAAAYKAGQGMDLAPGPDLYEAAALANLTADRALAVEHDPEWAQLVAKLNAKHPALRAVVDLAYRAGQKKAARCPGCDHLLSDHSEGGCWYSVSTARQGANVVCVCVVEAR